MRDAIIFMTALVPTTGHLRMVRFAQDFLAADGGGRVLIIIGTRPSEPTSFAFRAAALAEPGAAGVEIVVREHDDALAPQNPSSADDPEFWAYWREAVYRAHPDAAPAFVFASETYGADLARVLGCEFVPVDIAREVNEARGTDVRAALFRSAPLIAPKARRALTSTWVMFGAESVGKTSLARDLARSMGGSFHHEWARPYLEAVGAEVTADRMTAIFRGQSAVEAAAERDDSLLRFLDTDLLSTIGYYKLCGLEPHPLIEQRAAESQERLRKRYLLISEDGVPFAPDPLRYGGDRRESGWTFWANLLDERGLEYSLITGDCLEERSESIRRIIMTTSPGPGLGTYDQIINFRRD